MNMKLGLLCGALAMTIAMGCGNSDIDDVPPAVNTPAAMNPDTVEPGYGRDLGAPAPITVQINKEELENRLNQWEERLQALKEASEDELREVGNDAEIYMKQLEQSIYNAEEKLDAMGEATAESAVRLRDDFNLSLEEIERNYNQALESLKTDDAQRPITPDPGLDTTAPIPVDPAPVAPADPVQPSTP